MSEKTYRERNIKYITSLLFLLLFSVAILLYLLSIGNFLPQNIDGGYNVLNIFVFSILSLLAIYSLLSLLIYFFIGLIVKNESAEIVSSKFSILITFGLFLVFLLNFLHILDIYWGLGILVILLVISFVI